MNRLAGFDLRQMLHRHGFDYVRREVKLELGTLRPMFMTEPPSFDVLLRELANAENAINSWL